MIPYAFRLVVLALSLLAAPAAFADSADTIEHEPLKDDRISLSTIESSADPMVAPPRRPEKFDLLDSRNRAAFAAEAKKLLELSGLQKKVKKARGVLRFPYEIKSGGRKALERAIELLPGVGQGDRAALREIRVLMASFEYNLDYPVKQHYQILPEVPLFLIKGMKHKVVREGDTRQADPAAPSTFWQPRKIEGADLRSGFGRASLPDYENAICTYIEPKTGWGAHPGFSVNCGGKENVKFKLGDEIYSGPFNTRIFWLMGYNVTAIDPVRELKVRYDRRILSQFHSRRHLEFDVRFLFLKLKKKVITNYTDPFLSIQYALLQDGSKLTGMELKKRLLKVIPAGDPTDPKYNRPEEIKGNFREELERQISYLAFVPGAMAEDPSHIKAIGPFKYEDFGVAELREVRAIQLLSAWVGNYNMRWENTRLSYVEIDGKWQLRHMLSDVGSGLGASKDLLHMSNSEIGEFEARVTEPARNGVKLSGFMQNNPNPAFDGMTLEDARWMLKKIASLSKRQLKDALSATTMSPELRQQALEKLLSRRAHMIRDFGL